MHAQVVVKIDAESRSEPIDGLAAEKGQTDGAFVALEKAACLRVVVFAG